MNFKTIFFFSWLVLLVTGCNRTQFSSIRPDVSSVPGDGGSGEVEMSLIPGEENDGWASVTPSSDSRLVYVSVDGEDTNGSGPDLCDELTETYTKRTLGAGIQCLRDGFPDFLYIRRGDQFYAYDPIGDGGLSVDGDFRGWQKSGRSPSEPMRVLTYGTSSVRPVIMTGKDHGITSGGVVQFVTFSGLEFFPNLHFELGEPQYPPHGVRWIHGGSNITFEDMKFSYYFNNMTFDILGGDVLRDLLLYRNILVDAFTTSNGHSQGLYYNRLVRAEIVENLFDHNGWREGFGSSAEITIFRHNVYGQTDNDNVRLRRNIVARGDGLSIRHGAIIEDTLCMDLTMCILQSQRSNAPSRSHITRKNVILYGRDFNANPGMGRGYGIIQETSYKSTIEDNIIAHNQNGNFPWPITTGATQPGELVQNVVIRRNKIYNWWPQSPYPHSGIRVSNSVRNIRIEDNQIQSNQGNPSYMIQVMGAEALQGLVSSNNVLFKTSPTAWFQVLNSDRSLSEWSLITGDDTSRSEDLRARYRDPTRDVNRYTAEVLKLGRGATFATFLIGARNQSRMNWRRGFTARAVNEYVRQGFELDSN